MHSRFLTLLYKSYQFTHLDISFSVILFFHLELTYVLDRDKFIFVLSSSIGKVSMSKQGARVQGNVISRVARNMVYFLSLFFLILLEMFAFAFVVGYLFSMEG
jgi:penicillin-binding protein-related factor A (putative recombinase)